jgi:hypothetical protein
VSYPRNKRYTSYFGDRTLLLQSSPAAPENSAHTLSSSLPNLLRRFRFRLSASELTVESRT